MQCLVQAYGSNVYSEEFNTTDNNYFNISGYDQKSVEYINWLSEFAVISLLDFIKIDNPELGKKSSIKLLKHSEFQNLNRKAESVLSSNNYLLFLSSDNSTIIYLNWCNELNLYSTIEAIIIAYVQNLCISNYQANYKGLLPSNYWFIKALSSRIHIMLCPKVENLYYLKASNQLIDLKSFDNSFYNEIKTNSNDDILNNSNSFVIYKWIESISANAAEILKLKQNALIGNGCLEDYIELITRDKEFDTKKHFAQFLNQKRFESRGLYMDIESSKLWLESLSNLSLVSLSSIPEINNKNLIELWDYRGNTDLRSLIDARIELITLALNRINPLYYNAAHSLALTYNSVLNSSNRWECISFLAQYLEDLDLAVSMHEDILKNLN